MEIRANYIIVGVFTLAVLLGGFVFTLWVAKQSTKTAMVEYDISFNESVRGLSTNSDVVFTGIRVGNVKQIKISDTKPGVVTVRVAIAADTPVRDDSKARLELQGLTGTSIISISGGTAASPLVHVEEGHVGVIAYQPSPLASVMQHIPDTIGAANEVLHRMDSMLSDQNQQALTTTLESLAKVSSALASRADSLEAILRNTEKTSGQIDALTRVAGENLQATTGSLSRIAQRMDTTLSIMEPGLRQFSKEGLTELRMLLVESRNLVHIYTRIGQKLESDPRRFLFGEPVQEYRSR